MAFKSLSGAERLRTPQSLPPDRFRNFLLLQYPLALGAAIHSTPLISALHGCVPGARVAAAASGFSAAVLEGNPGLEQLVVTPNPLQDFCGAVRVLREVRWFGGEPFAVLQTAGNERTRISFAAMLSGGHQRFGFSVQPELMRAALNFDRSQSVIANNLHLLDLLGHGSALSQTLQRDPEFNEPQVFPGPRHFAAARKLLSEAGMEEGTPRAIFITQTSVTQRKSWRPERFAAVAAMLREQYAMQIVFVGTAAEARQIDELRAGIAFPTASVAGRTSLLELSALMALSDVAVSLDTGPMHLARAAKLPTVIIAPAWSPPVEWLPIHSPRARILKNADLPSAPEDYLIDEVSVAEVEAALHGLLRAYPQQHDRVGRRLFHSCSSMDVFASIGHAYSVRKC